MAKVRDKETRVGMAEESQLPSIEEVWHEAKKERAGENPQPFLNLFELFVSLQQ